MKKRFRFKFITLIFICAILAIGVSIPLYGKHVDGEATAYSSLPSTPATDDNLFLEKIGKFNLTTLDSLAKAVGFSSAENMVTNYSTVKTATNFGTSIVALGSYKAQTGVQKDLYWIPTYLSKDKSGNVILTLWLAQTEANNKAETNSNSSYQERSYFSDGTYNLTDTKPYTEPGTSTSVNIYSDTYDGSYIRHAILNGSKTYVEKWGQFWDGKNGKTSNTPDTRVSFPSDASVLNKFTILTSGALSSYIVAPENVQWQLDESTCKNDIGYNGSDKGNYPTNWKKDKIWLPSTSEVQNGALWKTTLDQRINAYNNHTYLRSVKSTAPTNDRVRVGVLAASAISDGTNSVAAGEIYYNYDVGCVQWAVRPAFHLNLTQVIANGIRPVKAPSDVTTTFNGNAQEVSTLSASEKPDWFDTSKVVVSYATSSMINADTYSATVKLASTSNKEAWRDTGDTKDKTISFTINPKSMTLKYTKNASNLYDVTIDTSTLAQFDTAKPTNNDLTVVYTKSGSTTPQAVPLATSGSYTVRASLPGFTNYTISNPTYDFTFTRPTVTVPTISTPNQTYEAQLLAFAVSINLNEVEIDDTDSGAVWDSTNCQLTATEVGDYTVKAHLKDAAHKDWADGTTADKNIVFHITKATANVIITDDGGNATLTCGRGSTPNLVLNVGTLKTDLTKFNIYATKGSDKFLLASNILVDTASPSGQGKTKSFAINTMALQVGNTYTVAVEYTDVGDEKNGSYTLKFIGSLTLNITAPEKKVNVLWQVKHGSVNDNFAAGDTRHVVFDKPLMYDGTPFEWTVDVPTLMFSDFRLDSDYETNGYKNATYTDAGTYTTSVRIISNDTNAVVDVFEIEWTVDKKIFDLAQMNWKGNGELEFSNSQQTMELENVPSVLKANYGGIFKWKDVKDPVGIASVTSFSFTDPAYADNYVLPVKSNPDSFINTDGAFEWEIEWKIVPKKIHVEWGTKQLIDSQGYVYDVAVLLDENYRSLVTHTYFEVDQSGTKLDPDNPVNINSVTVPKQDINFYICELSLASANGGYELDGDTTSNVFMIGRLETGVVFTLGTASVPYTGGEVALTFSNDGNLFTTDYTLKYYLKDGTPLDSVPTDAGKYWVEVVLNDSVLQDYYIASVKEFEFEITPRKIAENWLENVKPFRLNLALADIGMIEYRFADSAGNPVTFDQMKSAPGQYQIQASIKEDYRNGCSFAGGSAFTDWKEFTLTDADLATLEDPNDPNNYGETPIDPGPGTGNEEPPVDPGDGGDKGGNSIIDFFKNLIEKNFPLWQIATMAVSALLALIFMIKAIQYSNKAKQAKGEAKKISSRAYAALLPVFSTDIVLAGLSNQIWSIMAFSLVGVSVLMFVLALIMRKSWKKAELAKETAVDESERRKYDKQNASQLALQEKITQIGLAGQQGASNSSLIEEMRREMENQRREDEARHREEMAALREEQAKRDEAMKMMLANLMGRQVGNDDMIYGSLDDTDLLVQKVIAGLLPAVQQMVPEATAYLTAPNEQNEELLHIVEEQNAQMQAMTEQMNELQAQLASMHEMADAVIIQDNSDDIKAMTDEMNALRQQIASLGNQPVTMVASDNSGDLKAMVDEMNAMRRQIDMLSQDKYDSVILDEDDEDIFDDEEEWDSILDEDEEDNFVESVIIEADGTVRKVSPNFRMRLKQSSDKNRDWYAVIKNMFCSQKGVTYRVQKRVEKIRYQGQVIGVIGIAKRSIKLWLALKPYEYDARRYHHKDVSDKPRFVDVPMYVRVGSDRALERAQELILALFQEFNMEARKRYHDRDIQELIFTLKHNKLLNNKYNKTLLREIVHVHDCDVLDDETAEKCVESKNVDFVDNSALETVKLDDIDAHFLDGNRVTLEKLKKVGLVSEDCTGVNIVADKRLTKPLIIVANDFSLSAVKMIVLTGGRAIKLAQVAQQ